MKLMWKLNDLPALNFKFVEATYNIGNQSWQSKSRLNREINMKSLISKQKKNKISNSKIQNFKFENSKQKILNFKFKIENNLLESIPGAQNIAETSNVNGFLSSDHNGRQHLLYIFWEAIPIAKPKRAIDYVESVGDILAKIANQKHGREWPKYQRKRWNQ